MVSFTDKHCHIGRTRPTICYLQETNRSSPLWFSRLRTCLVSLKMLVQSLASLSGLSIQHCPKLWCGLQIQFSSGIAVAMVLASVTALIQPLAPGIFICCGFSPPTPPKKGRERQSAKYKMGESNGLKKRCVMQNLFPSTH